MSERCCQRRVDISTGREAASHLLLATSSLGEREGLTFIVDSGLRMTFVAPGLVAAAPDERVQHRPGI
ncbi:MAG: hypothetical protein ACRDNG_13900 [Gaiellaceae bacterium]